MATNSVLNQGLAPQFVAAETLRTLVPVLQPIKEIAVTDFSSYVDRIGNVVHTRLASPLTSATYDPSLGFVEQSAVAADIAVQLTAQTYVDIAFTDIEQGSISAEMLRRVFLAPMTESVAKSMFDNLLALCTAGNFSNVGYSGATSGFTRAGGVVPLQAKLTSLNITYEGRTALIAPDAYAQLLADPTIAQYLSIGDNSVIREGQANENANGYLGKIHGIKFWEYAGFPGSGTYPELAGIASAKQGLVIATRVAPQITVGGGTQETITDEDSGFALAFRQYYNWQEGKMHLNVNFIQGSAVGNPGALARIVFTS